VFREAEEIVEGVEEELEECILRKIPGADSSSILCCGIDAYIYACDFSWNNRYKMYVRSRMTLVPLLSLSTAALAF
jgi:hypothetical protein